MQKRLDKKFVHCPMQHSASSYAQQCTARCKTVHRRMHKLMKASETNFCLNMHMQSKNNSFDFENKPFGLNIKKHGLHSMLLNAIRVYDISLIEFYFNPNLAFTCAVTSVLKVSLMKGIPAVTSKI